MAIRLREMKLYHCLNSLVPRLEKTKADLRQLKLQLSRLYQREIQLQ